MNYPLENMIVKLLPPLNNISHLLPINYELQLKLASVTAFKNSPEFRPARK